MYICNAQSRLQNASVSKKKVIMRARRSYESNVHIVVLEAPTESPNFNCTFGTMKMKKHRYASFFYRKYSSCILTQYPFSVMRFFKLLAYEVIKHTNELFLQLGS